MSSFTHATPLALAGAVLLAACGAETAGCQPVVPNVMPDGTQPGQYAASMSGEARVALWRSGETFVLQRILAQTASSYQSCPTTEVPTPEGCNPVGDVAVRGAPAALLAAGRDDDTQWLLAWAAGGCYYETAVGPMTRDEAEAYAADF
jgi:hypothetical protein